MGCFGRKQVEIRPEQKWDAISLRDFKSTSCFTPLAYGYLYFSLLISIAVYGVDTFTAINLLAFNTWSSTIEPTQLVPFDVSKWIFSICIIFSFINLGFEHLRAMRVMKRGSVAECYLDNLAVRLESVRFGEGQGWRRFLVFAELTKSKKGAEYVALFTYFSFQAWIRVIFCSGPRQVINALTLYSVYNSDLIPTDVSSVQSTLGTFFGKLQHLADENKQQVVILSGMVFTLVIWVFSVLFLLIAALFYVFFLWHYIPRQDGGLAGYCERKVNKRLTRIVTIKVNKAIAKEERNRMKAEVKAAKKTGEKTPVGRQATLPTFMDDSDDKLPEMPMLNRNDTMATLPAYSSRPGSSHSIELNPWDQKRPGATRQNTTTTNASSSSFSSRAPLLPSAAGMGFDRSASPAPTLPQIDLSDYQPPQRPGTAASNRSLGPGFAGPGPSRLQTSGNGFGGGYTASPSTYSASESLRSPPPMDNYNRPMPPRPMNQMTGRSSPAPSNYSGRGPPPGPPPGPAYGPNGQPYPPPRKLQWHPGERAMHQLLHVSQRGNPTHHGLPPHLGYRVAESPLVAFGALDRHGRPWATVWGGEKGFCRPIAEGVLGVGASADVRFDPVLRALFEVPVREEDSEDAMDEDEKDVVDDFVVQPEGGAVMAGLSIDLETRDRVKLAGRMVAGSVTRRSPGIADLQMVFRVEESLGNCPKYLNKKVIVPHTPKPRLASEGSGIPLPRDAIDIIQKADLFFIASKHGSDSMDANHRGGSPGFVRVLRNEKEGSGGGGLSIVYPEYSGNRLYQTLGNLRRDPYAGLVFPDFDTGDVVYVTGRTTILVGEKAADVMPRAKLVVRIDVTEARFVREGLPFRGVLGERSPYNPAVRKLAAEQRDVGTGDLSDAGVGIATLVSGRVITPSISRYIFRLTPHKDKGRLRAWQPGHHVTFDFADELDKGYSHMRDDDPQSLNDDFVRTFTVSKPLDPADVDGVFVREGARPEVEITVRRHGPATKFLESWDGRRRVDIPILGFGGAEGFRMGLRVLWSLKADDLPLAVDVLERIDGLGEVTKLFVTGGMNDRERGLVNTVQGLGAAVLERRIGSADVLAEGEKGSRKFYCCTGPEMMRLLLGWTEGEEVLYESFEY
ncbi:uncharacterized protein F4807DRAFT_450997 [Annulohypoxylon truncatum]|uniref:uncharacterized protein n=1 Tax=Annulohypoxylon truncatum TaxID=327061 RepID=UPI002008DED6|nr:uncharacterized protein F4807DRAFT_450997 [Annulohypoxylon truncatum]KAI1211339.1 hypothetical protein F4807DRAFT_450997 [Annulohypoxylon truncatum]